jgi:hypothetical protein
LFISYGIFGHLSTYKTLALTELFAGGAQASELGLDFINAVREVISEVNFS